MTCQADKQELDALVRRFFAIFTNTGGATPRVEAAYGLFIPEGIVVKNTGSAPEIYSLREFVEPRRKWLTNGTLVDFEEAEVSERTDVFGNIAQRFSTYRKSGVLSGEPFAARGMKVMQFVRTPAGWRFSSVAWDDERDGLALPDPGAAQPGTGGGS